MRADVIALVGGLRWKWADRGMVVNGLVVVCRIFVFSLKIISSFWIVLEPKLALKCSYILLGELYFLVLFLDK